MAATAQSDGGRVALLAGRLGLRLAFGVHHVDGSLHDVRTVL
jgi:hypothetical protein